VSEGRMQDIELAEVSQQVSKPFHNRSLLSKGRRSQLRDDCVAKSPSGLCEIEICNYRIGPPVLLNRCCAFQPDLESIFLAEMLKILLQHNRSKAAVGPCRLNVRFARRRTRRGDL